MSSPIVNFNSGLDEVQLYNVGGARLVKDSKLYKYKDDSDLDVELQPHVDQRLPGHQETGLNSSGCPREITGSGNSSTGARPAGSAAVSQRVRCCHIARRPQPA